MTAISTIDDILVVKDSFCRLTGGGDDHFDQCCAEARTHVPCPLGLTPAERLAVWLYSSTDARWYERINLELRQGSPSPDVVFFEEVLNRALGKLPAFIGEAYRGMTVPDLDDHVSDYRSGAEVKWDAFTSSSKEGEKAFKGNVLFIISSQSGRVLGEYADKPAEEEVLFRSGSKFTVLATERIDDLLIVSVAEITQ